MVAINTNYKNDISIIEAIEEQLKNIADAGFSHVQWGHDWRGEYIYSNIEMVQIKQMLGKYNFKLKENEDFKKRYWEQAFKSFDELESYCKARGVKIAVENLLCTPQQEQIDQFDKLFARYDFDFIGFCFDSGHGTLVSLDDHLFFAKRYKDRIIALHLQDTDGIAPELIEDGLEVLKHDKHALPFTGIINWDELAKIVAQSPYELPVTLEVILKADTYEEEMFNLKDALGKAEKLNEMVKSYRK